MKAEDFIKEVKESGIQVDDFDRKYAEFQGFQQMGIQMLLHFRDLCEMFKVHYQLGFGTLLGAVRDGGRIPWDYDIDVFVPYEEKDHLIEVLQKNLDSKYYISGPEIDKRCPRSLLRIGIVGYSTDEMHIDVFYYAGASDDKKEQTEMTRRLAEIQSIRFAKYVNPFTFSYGSLKRFVGLFAKKLRYIFVSGDKILKEYDKICSRYKMADAKFVFLTGRHAINGIYRKEDMYETRPFEIDYGVFQIPVGYDTILRTQYGGDKYLQYYPLESRLKEFLSNYNKLVGYSQKKFKTKN